MQYTIRFSDSFLHNNFCKYNYKFSFVIQFTFDCKCTTIIDTILSQLDSFKYVLVYNKTSTIAST